VIRAAAALSVAALFLVLPIPPNVSDVHAGAWLRAPQEIYAKAALFRVRGEDAFDEAGGSRALFDPALYERGRYLESGGSFYGEIGLARDVTLFGDLLLKIADNEAVGRGGAGDISGRSIGIPDLRAGVRLPVARGRVAAAIEPTVSIPLVKAGGGESGAPRIGSGTAAFAAALYAGTAIPSLNGYAQAGGGYRTRSGKPSDELFPELAKEVSHGRTGTDPAQQLVLFFR
jgi:hypothetical protein